MKQRIIACALIASALFPLFPGPALALEANPSYLISDEEMTDTFAMTKAQLDAFLTRGSLGTHEGPDVNGRIKSAADIIWEVSQEFDLNPQFLLVLLQREQSLVEADNPTQDQLDWAMGYAICDDCDKDDPGLQKYRGFGNQVYWAAKKIRESYLVDLASRGTTLNGTGPEIPREIDGVTVIPANFATAVLYTYTPHLHGNANFVRIWQRWFVRDYPSGSLLQDSVTGGIYLIKNGTKRPITSKTAFLTRFNPSAVVPVRPTTLEAYPLGAPISFPNYSLLRSPRGTVFLIVDDTRRGFTSQEALRSIGINPDEIIDVTWDDLNAYAEGEPITATTSSPIGSLEQDAKTGGVFYIENGTKHPIMSREILNARFPAWAMTKATSETLSAIPTGDPVTFQDGTLIGVTGRPDVFVVSDGKRLPIVSGDVFEAYGWKWDQVVWTNERSVLLQPLGDTVTLDLSDEDPTELQVTSIPTSYQLPPTP